MKKRVFALFLALCLLAFAGVPSAFAASEDPNAARTVRALGIIVGDGSGSMDLDAEVTRAQFAKMLVAASAYRNTVSPDGTGYSLYQDVKSSHWASEYIRLAAQEGWMTGYTDGAFRPDHTITLEEACSSVLSLLGYDAASLAGSFPYAQLSKASALGLRDDVARARGETMTRGDCVYLFYNLLTARTASGQVYATTLGYTLTNGEVNYASVMLESVSGPYVAASGQELPFTPQTIYRDGKASASPALAENDVYYYSRELDTAWIYTKRVSGKLESVSASGGTPTSVTVSGKSYSVGSMDAAYLLSSLAGTEQGSYATLLFGMNDAVVGVLTGKTVNGMYYGVVTSSTRGSSDSESEVKAELTLLCADGMTRTFSISRGVSYGVGSIVAVTVTDAGATAESVSAHLGGKIDSGATRLGDYKLAENVRILDVGRGGAAVSVEPERLANTALESSDVSFYALNTAGEIETLILSDVTGDTWTYACLTKVDKQSDGSISYTWVKDGSSGSLRGNGVEYPVKSGGIALVYANGGTTLSSMYQLSSADISELNADTLTATADNKAYRLTEGTQVYLRQGGSYYPVELSAVNTGDYTLTGWYDTFTGPAGGAIRIIVATPKQGG